MKALARFLLLLCLLPGLVTGLLPLPGQAAGLEMVICAEGGAQTIRIAPDGTPMSDAACDDCCPACGPTLAQSGEPAGLSLPFALRPDLATRPARSAAPARSAHLFPAPRGPPILV